MERDTCGDQLGHIVGDFYPLLELMDETNFLQSIDLIREESIDPFDSQMESVFNPSYDMINAAQLAGDAEEGSENLHEESSTTRRTPPRRKGKGDRSRTVVSERRRRSRMKEKLYELRALVPNITKMDKASIIGDALLYLQDLQTQAKKLKSEIAVLESSLGGRETEQRGIVGNQKNTQLTNINHPICKNIFQLDMFQVEEGGFYGRVECNRGRGVAPSLYKALESLNRLSVPSSNLGTLAERFILTFTLKVKECEPNTNLQKLKLGLTEAFLKQGFVFQTQASAA